MSKEGFVLYFSSRALKLLLVFRSFLSEYINVIGFMLYKEKVRVFFSGFRFSLQKEKINWYSVPLD